MRVYAPATRADLAWLHQEGSWTPSAGAYAVTPSLAAWASADGPADDEELELVALSEAARHALRLVGTAADPDVARRVVVVLDLPADLVAVDDAGPDDPVGRVRLDGAEVPLARVAAVHLDEASAGPSIAAAAAVVEAADAGDTAAEAVVARLDDHDLLWYDPAELPTLVESGRTGPNG